MVMDSRTFSCPSGGRMQMAAISFTASSITCGSVGFSDLHNKNAIIWGSRVDGSRIFFFFNIPGDEGDGLLVLEDVLEPDLVVHDGLQAADALVLDLLPFAVAGKI